MAKKATVKRIIKGKDYSIDKNQDSLRKAGRKGWRKSNSNAMPTKKEIQEFYDGKRNDIYMESRPNRSDSNTRAKKGERFSKGGEINASDIKDLANGYKSAILFTSTDEDDTELDSNYSVSDFDSKSNAVIEKMAKKYISDNKEAIDKAIESGMVDYDQIGMDIWYAQSGQGVGFFDRDLDKDVEEKLTKGAKKFGDLSHHVFAQDGKVYIEGMKFANGGAVDNGEAKSYKINNTTAIESELNKYLYDLNLKEYSNSMGTYSAKLTGKQLSDLIDLISDLDKNNNVYILNSMNEVVYDSAKKDKFAKGGVVKGDEITLKNDVEASYSGKKIISGTKLKLIATPDYVNKRGFFVYAKTLDGKEEVRTDKKDFIEKITQLESLFKEGGEIKNRTTLSEEEKQFVREESQEAGQGYTYRAKLLRGEHIILKEKDGQPIQKFTVDNFEVGSKMSAMLNKANDKEKNKMAKGGKVDRTKSVKKNRVNRTKKAIAQDKNIKALHAGKRLSENDEVYYEYRLNRSDVNRTKKLAKGGDLKNYTSADLPKDGSPIEIHMPKMGSFPAEDITIKYNKDNFGFDAYRNGEISASRITEKQVLDNLNNGSYEFKNDTEEFAKGGEVISFVKLKFNSHENHNPNTDILEGHIDNDSFITYGVYVNGENKGDEYMEYYKGSNYVVGSDKKSSSRHYKKDAIPTKYLSSWNKLKQEYEENYSKEEYAKGGTIKEVDFENSNVIFYGFSHDKNGNSVVKVGFPNQSAFSLQINDPSWFRFTKGKYTKNVGELEPSDIIKIEEEVVEYIRNFGSKKQKESLKVYSKFKGGIRDAKEVNGLLQDAIKKTKDLSAKEIADMWNANINTKISKSWNEEEVSENISYFRSYLKDLLFEKQLTEAEYSEYFKDGGSIGFEGLAKKVAKEYEGDKVKPEYQDEYGKRYDKEEAKEVGAKVAAKVYQMQQSKLEQGGEVKGMLSLSEIESKLGKTFSFWNVPYEVSVNGNTYRKILHKNEYKKI